jgi:DNA-binding CsgD family transcriptional regulator
MGKKDVRKRTSGARLVHKDFSPNRAAQTKAACSNAAFSPECKFDHSDIADIQESIAIKQMELLDAMNSAAILLDARGNVICSNRTFLQLPEDGISLHGQKLIATDSRSNAKLQRLVRKAMAVESESLSQESPTVVLVRRNRRPLLATLLIVHKQFGGPQSRCAILLITDPDKRLRPDEAILRGAFGLTPPEVKLAQCLATGGSLGTAAIHSNISQQTVARQLKAIFRKTKLHRRSQLRRLLVSLRNPPQNED